MHALAVEHGLAVRDVVQNEFAERSFVLTGPDGASWQVLTLTEDPGPAVTNLELTEVAN